MVLKVIEILGTSDKSWDDAVRQAVATAAKTVRHMTCVDVIKKTAKIENDRIVSYTATCKICFEIHPEEHHQHS